VRGVTGSVAATRIGEWGPSKSGRNSSKLRVGEDVVATCERQDCSAGRGLNFSAHTVDRGEVERARKRER
jgi:hypothetical protein